MKKFFFLISALVLTTTALAGEGNCNGGYESGASTAYFTYETAVNGDVNLIISGNEGNLMFRKNQITLSVFSLKVGEESLTVSDYFDESFISSDGLKIVLPLKDGMVVPSGAVIGFTQYLEWKSDKNNDGWAGPETFSMTYGDYCCVEERIFRGEVESVSSNSADLRVDSRCMGSKYSYRLKYKLSSSAVWSVIDGIPADGLYSLTNLISGSAYQAVAEAISKATSEVSYSVPMSFTTLDKLGSEICDYKFTAFNSIYLSMETQPNGDVVCKITRWSYDGGSYEGDPWFNIGESSIINDISYYKVTVGNESYEASEYFDGPVVSADMKSFTFKKKKDLPNGSVIELAKSGKINWWEGTTGTAARWVDTPESFAGFKHSYGTVCCSLSKDIRADVLNISTSSADIKFMDNCIYGEGFKYRLKYKVDAEQADYIVVSGRPDDGVYHLTSLYGNTPYVAVVEAAYPDFQNPEIAESTQVNFTTLSHASEVCSQYFIGTQQTECYISMETLINGDIKVSIVGDNDTKFRVEGLTSDLSKYSVNGNPAADYFAEITFHSTYVILKLKSNAIIPENATIKFFGVIAWTSTKDDWLLEQTLTHTYGTWCCEADGFRIGRAEALTTTTAVVNIDNLCIEDKPYVYRYSLKEGEGDYGAPVEFSGKVISLTGLTKNTEYTIKVEAAVSSFESPADAKTQVATFTTPELDPNEGVYVNGVQYATLKAALDAVQDGDAVTLFQNVDEDLVAADKSFTFNGNGHSVKNVEVGYTDSKGAEITLAGALKATGNLTLKSGSAHSGAINANGNSITVAGNAYYEKKLFDSASEVSWYAVSLPFDASLSSATDAEGNKYVMNEDFGAARFDGAKAATGANGWSVITSGTLNAGTAYLLTIRYYDQKNTVKFTASNKSQLVKPNTIELTAYEGSAQNKGWNAIGNNQMTASKIYATGISYAAVFVTSTNAYRTEYLLNYVLNPGDALFLQTDADKAATLTKGALKSAEEDADPFQLRIKAEGSTDYDQCFITASAEAADSYIIGKDLKKMAGYKSYGYATIWINAKGAALSAVDAKLTDGAAIIPLGINAPDDGVYNISLLNTNPGQTLTLLKNGVEVWNFESGAYVATLNKGENSSYSVKIEENIYTGVSSADATSISAYIKDGVLYVNGVENGQAVLLYSILKQVASIQSDGTQITIPVEKGVYIVKVGESVIKLLSK